MAFGGGVVLRKSKPNWEKRLSIAYLLVRITLVLSLILGGYALYPRIRSILDNGSKGSEALTATLTNTSKVTDNLNTATGRISDLIGPTEKRDEQPQTVAHTVALVNDEIQPTGKAARKVLADTSEAVQAATDLTTDGRRTTESVNRSLGTLDTLMAQAGNAVEELKTPVSDAVKGTRPVLENVASITGQIADAAPLYLDCDHNPDCAFNRFQGTSKAIEKASQAITLRLPDFLDTAQDTNRNFGHMVSTFDGAVTRYFAPSPLRDKLLKLIPIAGELFVVGKAASK